MEEQTRTMKTEDEEKFGRYMRKMSEKVREKVNNGKSAMEYVNEVKKYLMRLPFTRSCDDAEEAVALILAACFSTRKAKSL